MDENPESYIVKQARVNVPCGTLQGFISRGEILKDVFSSSPIPISELPQYLQIEEMPRGIDQRVSIIM